MKEELIKLRELLGKYKFYVNDEKVCQQQIHKKVGPLGYKREHRFSPKDIIDFYNKEKKIGIEVKIKGNAQEILVQCERYLQHEDIQGLLLATNRSIGFPTEINNKPVVVLTLGESWL